MAFIALSAGQGCLSLPLSSAAKHKALQSLQAVHDAGIIHGDVSLAKCVWAPNGGVWLIDFAHCIVLNSGIVNGDELKGLDLQNLEEAFD